MTAGRYLKSALGIPSWLDAGAYPGEGTSDAEWRWEFLRRRPDYRKAWADQYDESQARFDEMDSDGLFRDEENGRETFYALGTSLRSACEPFGLRIMLAPSSAFRPMSPPLFLSSAGFGLSHHGNGHPLALKDNQFAIVFDISKSLSSQLERAKRFLTAVQGESFGEIKAPRHHRGLWAGYLRAIDAREAGATFEFIYEEIHLRNLPQTAYDAKADKEQNWSALGLQVWKQAQDLMFKLTAYP